MLLPEVGVAGAVVGVHHPLSVRRPGRVTRQRRVLVGDALQAATRRRRPGAVTDLHVHGDRDDGADRRHEYPERHPPALREGPPARTTVGRHVAVHVRLRQERIAGVLLLDLQRQLGRVMRVSVSVVQLRRHLGQLPHGGDEPIAVAGNGDDEVVLVGALPERTA